MYITPVVIEREKEFLHFLRDLGIPDDCILSEKEARGDYRFYRIEIPKSSDYRSQLNAHQTDFILRGKKIEVSSTL